MVAVLTRSSRDLLSVRSKEAFKFYKTNQYKLHFYETPTGLKLILTTSPEVGDIEAALKQIYSMSCRDYSRIGALREGRQGERGKGEGVGARKSIVSLCTLGRPVVPWRRFAGACMCCGTTGANVKAHHCPNPREETASAHALPRLVPPCSQYLHRFRRKKPHVRAAKADHERAFRLKSGHVYQVFEYFLSRFCCVWGTREIPRPRPLASTVDDTMYRDRTKFVHSRWAPTCATVADGRDQVRPGFCTGLGTKCGEVGRQPNPCFLSLICGPRQSKSDLW